MTSEQLMMLAIGLGLTSCAYSLRRIRQLMGDKLSFWWF